MRYGDVVLGKVGGGGVCFGEIIWLLECRKGLKGNWLVRRVLRKIIKWKGEKYLDVDIREMLEEENSIRNDRNSDKCRKKIKK